MLAPQRQALILEEVRRSGGVRVAELTARLGVSDMTVRRDLDVLRQRGLLEKVHGGATLPPAPAADEPGFASKSLRSPQQKAAIAAAAAAMVHPGEAVAVGAGTTCHVLAHHLLAVPDLTVVSNSIPVAAVLRGRHTVVLTGGVQTPSDALVGPVADLVLRSLHVDVAFLGCHGMDPEAGLTTPNLAESETNRALVGVARRLVVLADASKWRTVGLVSFAELGEVSTLVTDEGLDEQARAALAEQVGELVVAAPVSASGAAAAVPAARPSYAPSSPLGAHGPLAHATGGPAWPQ